MNLIKTTLLGLVLYLIVPVKVNAQTTLSSSNSSDIYLGIKKLKVLGNVLYIGAHPDNSNAQLLAYLARERQYRTGYLSITRGESSRNNIGSEQGIELGLINTQEMLAARRIEGTEQFFTRAYDFGFSKNAEATFDTWNKENTLSDIVWIIRIFKPDIIISRHPDDEAAGNGQNRACAILAKEAFIAAGDSTKFPDQFKYGLKPWHARRLLWNIETTDTTSTVTAKAAYKLDVGGYNTFLGKSYGELAGLSRGQQKSQGLNASLKKGQSIEYFSFIAGDSTGQDIMENVIANWKDAGQADINNKIDSLISGYDFKNPAHSLKGLVDLNKTLQSLSNKRDSWVQQKIQEVNNLIILSSGIFAEATTETPYAVLGRNFKVNFYAIKQSTDTDITLSAVRLSSFDSSFNTILPHNQGISFSKELSVSENQPATQPFWLAKPLATAGMYNVENQFLIGKPEDYPPYVAQFVFSVMGLNIPVNKPVQYKVEDPINGEIYQPLSITMPITLSVSPNILLTNVKPGNDLTNNPTIKIQYTSHITEKKVPITISVLNEGFKLFLRDSVVNSKAQNILYSMDSTVDIDASQSYSINIPLKNTFINEHNRSPDSKLSVKLSMSLNGHKYAYSYYLRLIQYSHIPNITYHYRDMIKIVPDEIKTVGKRVGYIWSTPDRVPYSLQQMGYNVKILGASDLNRDTLRLFDAVITAPQAYINNPVLSAYYDTLMNYIKTGGNLIVQYNTRSDSLQISPIPFDITQTRVSDEATPVRFLQPSHPVFNYPNKITQLDFDGWVQDRSLYEAANFGTNYTALLSMNDKGEPASMGSLIIAKAGRGNFIYTALSLFRQLPAGVPGAYRLIANLIALPKNKP